MSTLDIEAGSSVVIVVLPAEIERLVEGANVVVVPVLLVTNEVVLT